MNPASDQTTSSVDALQRHEYRTLVSGQVVTLRGLFRKITGLGLSVIWAPTWPDRWSQHDLPPRSRLCRRFTAASAATLARCQACGMKHLSLTLKARQEGHNFLCHHGVRNFWFPISLRDYPVGIAFVQVQDGARARSVQTMNSPSADAAACPRGEPRSASTKSMTAAEFNRVAMLLQLILQHAQTSALADCDKKELTRVRQALLELRSVARRFREQLHRVIPALNAAPPAVQPQARSKQIVHDVLQCISEHYAERITLRQFARKMGLNLSYLSHLFSQSVGMPFKTYLTELRIEKARELLGNPANSISQVASAVGYSSENRFRIAFKKATSLSPRIWRETLRMVRPALLLWLSPEMEILETLGLPGLL